MQRNLSYASFAETVYNKRDMYMSRFVPVCSLSETRIDLGRGTIPINVRRI
jgi:hypothetical protein